MTNAGGFRDEHREVTREGLRPLALGTLLLALAMTGFEFRLGPAIAGHDLLLALFAGTLFFIATPQRMPAVAAAPAIITLALLSLWNALLPRPLAGEEAARSLYVALILMAVGAFVVSRLWVAIGLGLVLLGWYLWAVKMGFEPAPVVIAAALLAIPLHLARRASIERLLTLRRTDRKREVELQAALAAAEDLRRTLDSKVSERTEELAQAASELRFELSERQRASAERAALEARLQHEAMHDALTGLPNRALFLDRLGHAWRRTWREPNFRFAVLYLDLDRFKVINDTFGHEVGDGLLVGIAKRLPGCLRPTDTVARLGGDEFAVLLEGFTAASETVAIAERVRKALAEPIIVGTHELYASASIGIADGVVEGQPPEQYVRDADVAMYAAKSRGTPYERFDGGMHSPALARMRMETELRAAIEKEQFFLVYQPIVDLRTMRLEGFEALARWQHPSRGVVGPDEFISVAEETRLILPLTLWSLRRACKQAMRWREKSSASPPVIGVNLSAQLVTRQGMAAEILKVVEESGLPPSSLAVEVTESAVMASPQVAAQILGELRERGVQVYVDDFGTGYSSLAYLTTLPVDRLKIDRTFTAAMNDANRLRVVRTIASLAHDLGKTIVAEGVEVMEQLEALKAMNCEYGQGWLFSRPMNEGQADALVEANEQGVAFPGLVERTQERDLLPDEQLSDSA